MYDDESSATTTTLAEKIEKVLIMIHGSGRTAEDYYCVALSLVPPEERDRVLVIAPMFMTPSDLQDIMEE